MLRYFHDEWCEKLAGADNTRYHFVVWSSSQAHCTSVRELALSCIRELECQDTMSSGASHARQARDRIVALAPQILPLRGFLGLLGPSSNTDEFVVTTQEGRVVLAIVCREPTLFELARGGPKAAIEERCVPESAIHEIQDLQTLRVFEPRDDWRLPIEELGRASFLSLGQSGQEESLRHLPLWYIESLNAPLGAYARSLRPAAEVLVPDFEVKEDTFTIDDVDVVAVTTDRWRSVQKLLASIRKQIGDEIAITVVVQSRSSLRWRWLANRYGSRLLHVPEDSGLAWSRNHAITKTSRPLVFLMDDDFQLDERCRFIDALNILNKHPEISVLGGNLLDVETWNAPKNVEISQGFAMRMIAEEPDVVWLRLEDAPRQRHYVNHIDYIEFADIVDNFALIKRREVFDLGVSWNPSLKIGAEHQDLYIRLKRAGGAVVARTNALKVRNVRVQSRRFRVMRGRVDRFFDIFFRDLGLRSFKIFGERQRVRTQDGGHSYMETSQMIPHYIAPQEQK